VREALPLQADEVALAPTAVRTCRDVIVRHSRSFALASRLLPGRVRDEAWVVYAWCRRADDAIDAAPPEAQQAALVRLREELAAVYDGGQQTGDPTLAAFQSVVRLRRLPRAYPEALLDGMAMDVRGQRYETIADLLRYAYRVAGTVGLMMCHVMGVQRDHALVHATHLGIAMQLTNICRDVAEDWRLGRLYLPAELLARSGIGWLAGIRPKGELPQEARAPLAQVVTHLLELADAHYRSGKRGLPELSWRCALAVGTAGAVYGDIGRVLEQRGCDVTAGRAHVSTPRKLWLTARTALWMTARAPAYLWRRLWHRRAPRIPERVFRPLER
jgi:15-cis-phytoene synthase